MHLSYVHAPVLAQWYSLFIQMLILHHGLVPVWILSALLILRKYSLYTSFPEKPRHPNCHNLRPPDRNR